MSKTRIFLLGDYPVCRHGMAQMINSESDLVVCGETGTAARPFTGLRTARPDLILLDLAEGHSGGPELIQEIRAAEPAAALLAVSAREDFRHILRLLRAGAQGCLLRSEGLHDFIAAIRKVAAGQLYLNAAFGEQLIANLARGEKFAEAAAPLERLTPRELQVLRLIGGGSDNRGIAAELRLSPKTVETHRLHIKEKLGFASAAELLRFAVTWLEKQRA